MVVRERESQRERVFKPSHALYSKKKCRFPSCSRNGDALHYH
jgi:hypothetical protein